MPRILSTIDTGASMRKGSRKLQTIDDIKERFNRKVRITETGCHEWTGAKQSNGYGRFNFLGKSMYAHRVAALLRFGIVYPNIDVCHICDNRGCVNPYHLFCGTRKDNMQDCKIKNRTAKGSLLSKKLTDSDVIAIRQMYKTGAMQKDIAKKYGVTRSAIYHIIHNNTWRHIKC